MKIGYNKNEKNKRKHWLDSNLRIMDFLMPTTLPTALYKLISKSFQNYTCLLNMPSKQYTCIFFRDMPALCFDFNVYKQANVNMVIRSW